MENNVTPETNYIIIKKKISAHSEQISKIGLRLSSICRYKSSSQYVPHIHALEIGQLLTQGGLSSFEDKSCSSKLRPTESMALKAWPPNTLPPSLVGDGIIVHTGFRGAGTVLLRLRSLRLALLNRGWLLTLERGAA